MTAALLLSLGCSKQPSAPIPAIPLADLIVSPVVDTVRVNEQHGFTATALDSSGATVASAPLHWTSSNPGILTVDFAGRARGVSEGVALVFVSSGGLTDTARVTVMPALSGWFLQLSQANGANLNGVFFDADGRTGWVAGDAGKLLKTTDAGATWTPLLSGTSFSLHGVCFTSASEGWAVGANGTVLHTLDAGNNWTRVNARASEFLMAVRFASRDTGWAVGSAGVILRTYDRGVTWQKRYPTTSTLRGLAFAGTRDGWAVGDGGVVVGTHDRGQSWFTVTPGSTVQSLHAVWRRSEPLAWAAGSQGVAPRTRSGPDSTAWELQNAGASNQLEGICFPTDAIGYVVGLRDVGAVLRTDDGGVTWQTQVSGTTFRLDAVFFVDDRRGWAVGDNGTIIHTGTGGLP